MGETELTLSAVPAKASKLKIRPARLTVLICVALIAVAISVGYLIGQRLAIRALDAAASHRLEVFRASFFSPVERFEYLPELMASHPAVFEALNHPDDLRSQAALNLILQNASTKAGAAAVYVMNRDGLTISASNWDSPESFYGKDFSYRPYFQKAREGKVGRFYGVGSVTGIPGYFLASAVRDGTTIIGVVAVKVDLDTLDQRWLAESDQIAVTDDSGIIFLSTNKEWKYRTTRPLSDDVLHRLRETRQYATMLKSPVRFTSDPLWSDPRVVRANEPDSGETRRYFMLSHSLPQADWTITSYSSMAQAEQTAAIAAFIAAGGTAFVLLLAMYVRLVRRRMKEKEAARAAADAAHAQLEAKHRELEALSQHLQTMAISDPLTGCYNRRYFTEIAEKMVSAAQRHDRCISVLMLDIDFFKKINDNYGHPAGDEMLKAVAAACQSVLRQPDFLVRFGGEEFVAILPDTDTTAALVAAERALQVVQALQVETGQHVLEATVSIGIAEYFEGESSLDKALARADSALYHAKRSGRNRCVAYRVGMDEDGDEPGIARTAH
ncbi:diguanylate cyclase [Stutzerimonas sp. VN223-3]|uniref:sensor domain-containing diguanylate cyclase n=1 Tax=Stutzerimonas sp. VN223-3 TaxID=3384601 RepID=UPI0038B4C67B